ncbi:MAG: hypothetical protein UW93_C0010G0008 [Parcubacteria group bacterium GW2011_GWC1_45_13]|uniref:Uncharacterized protein n=1 Tax=Candidatus Giovannonibacteria bacterium GW2011_GWA1_44_29 TaxID=1618646 RepID=A0A0G1IW24_9BACT|nr:MAG: hypothetical protein UW57_C0009G0006 [Candidatus Giovannonibacteria bacterium GW2011_GWA1_44_29]KKT91236.1 MAG: hypothetical protein UW93_C0010G0008 [Parcubacteria group bacterium GW2011_GWC1_45_13]
MSNDLVYFFKNKFKQAIYCHIAILKKRPSCVSVPMGNILAYFLYRELRDYCEHLRADTDVKSWAL